MTVPSEVTITIRDQEKKTLKNTFLIYDPFTVSPDDPVIQDCINQVKGEFKGDIDQIKIRIKMDVE